MEELDVIIQKYHVRMLTTHFQSLEEINGFAIHFFGDAAEIYDCLTRLRNLERNPSGYSLDDAPIIGLLVRMWKLLKEAIRYHAEDNAEFIAIFQRTLLETAVTATYLLKHDRTVIVDYRKCSYKDRIRLLEDARKGSLFMKTKAGERIQRSIQNKLLVDGFSENDFAEQKRNKWKLQGKTSATFFPNFIQKKCIAVVLEYNLNPYTVHGMNPWIGVWRQMKTILFQSIHSSILPIFDTLPQAYSSAILHTSYGSSALKSTIVIIQCFLIGLRGRIPTSILNLTGYTAI